MPNTVQIPQALLVSQSGQVSDSERVNMWMTSLWSE